MQPGERVTVTCVDIDDDGAGVTRRPVSTPACHVAGALPDERVTAVVEHLSPHTRADAWARLDDDRDAVTGAAPAGLPGVRRVRRLRAAAPRLRRAARLEADARRARARGDRRRGGRLRRLAPAARLPQSVEAGGGAQRRTRLVLGAYAPRSHDVVDTAGCRIAEPPLDDTATALAALLDQAGVDRLRRADADRRSAPRRAAREPRRPRARDLGDDAPAAGRPGAGERVPGRAARRWSASSSTSTAAAETRSSRPPRATTACWPARRRSRIASTVRRPRRPAAALERRVLPGQPRRRRAGLRRDRGRAGGPPGRTRRRRLLRHRAGSPSRSRAPARRRWSASRSTPAPSPTPRHRRR